MRPVLIAAFLLISVLSSTPAQDGDDSKSLLESDPSGWTDLFAEGIKNWKRVSIPAGSKLTAKDCWEFDPATRVLTCHGAGVHEMLLYDKDIKDGVFHVEWRFKKIDGKAGYNSGVYVRNSADGKIWHQAQVGSLNVGRIFGDTLVDGKMQRINIKPVGEQRGKPAGEWNVYEYTFDGPRLKLWINGAITADWKECAVPQGYIGLEAEGYTIEFKNARLKIKK